LLVVDLHALVARAGVAHHDGDFALRPALLGCDFFSREGCGERWLLILALLGGFLVAGLLFCVAASPI
jgi:hypothetical protein